MRRSYHVALAVAAVLSTTAVASAQDASRTVGGGGISVAGWVGKADGGQKVSDSKLAKEGDALHVTTGPATTYWNPANKASGNYTVKATFTEPKCQNLNDHPHPYGIMIGGNDLDGDAGTYLYCAVNGNGSFIVRGFGPAAFQLNGGRGQANAAVHKAGGVGQSVTNEVAVKVTADKVSCLMTGTEVASYDKSAIVSAGKLKSTDGLYGIRFAHNTEGTVSGLSVTKQ